jgi:hypothetical protein
MLKLNNFLAANAAPRRAPAPSRLPRAAKQRRA